MARQQPNQEQDLRLSILNTLLTTPHRKLDAVWPVHQDMVKQDPRFYVRLAAWYADRGDVRDHQEMFIISLALSDFPGHRDVGLALLRSLPPYQVLRVLDFIHGRKTTKKVAIKSAGKRKVDEKPKTKTEVESFGLFKNPPRALKTEITRYLREREADSEWFDGSVLIARKAIKRLYALLHIKPGERAQKILFDEEPPADSRAFALKELAKATTPVDQARTIIEHRIPYRIAATVVGPMTPTVLLALIEVMSPQELINNLASLQRRGAMNNSDLKAAIEAKLEQAKTGKRVSAFKTGEAMKAAPLSAEVKAQLEKVADAQVKARGKIERPTALLVDKSGSMQVAIDLGKRIGAMISTVCASDLFVYAFDTMAYPIDRAGGDLATWEKSFQGITAGGGTSCGVAVQMMTRKRQYVEQIIMVTDEEENTAPLFVECLKKYREEMKADPNVCFVKVPRAVNKLEMECQRAGLAYDAFQFSGDYYSLPNLIPLVSRPSKLELLMEIMDYPLPIRKPA